MLLKKSFNSLSVKIYEQAAAEAEAAQGAEGSGEAQDDDVVDAEFEEVVEDEKK